MAFPAFAEEPEQPITGSCGEKLTWTYYQSTKTLTIDGNGNMPNYPADKYEGSIAPWRNNSNIDNFLEKVVISHGVTSIGENAFFWCDKITSVTIPSSVKSIGMGAFYCCKALEGITIPEGVTSIGKDAFSNCDGITSISIPGSVINIGYGAFSSCGGLTNVTVSEGVKNIDEYAFYYCSQLENITLPDSVTHIGVNAFFQTPIYNYDSEWNVLYIGNHFISANQNISGEYTVQSGTKTIADSAFSACGNLTDITIPNSVVSIGNHAFDSCGLRSITIPKNVTNIGECAFYTCFNLESINVNTDNPAYCSEDGILYNKEKTEIIRFPKGKQNTSFAIPDSVTSIAAGAFERCFNLTAVTLPDSVTSIGNDAFLYCSGLKSIIIPDGVEKICDNTFFDCSALTSITIPNSVLIIGENAFERCRESMKVNYIGSTEDWGEVIGDGKYVLTAANIIFCSGISAKHSEDKKNILVKVINIADGKNVILALYDGDRLVEVQQSGEYSENSREITFTPSKAYTNAKVMIWESLGSLSPVCNVKKLK